MSYEHVRIENANYPPEFVTPDPDTLYRRTDIVKAMRSNYNLGAYSDKVGSVAYHFNLKYSDRRTVSFREILEYYDMLWPFNQYENEPYQDFYFHRSRMLGKQWKMYRISQIPAVDEKGRYVKK